MNQYDPEKLPEKEFQKELPITRLNKPFRPFNGLLIETILEAIGHTPIVRLNKIPQSMGIEAEIRKANSFILEKKI
jgi:hypothetical protein